MPRRIRLLSALLGVLAVVAVACGGGGNDSQSSDTKPGAATSTTPPAYLSYVAQAQVPKIKVYDSPTDGAAPVKSFDNPWLLNDDPNTKIPLVFLAQEFTTDQKWTKVLLPSRPNGSTGWVRMSDVEISKNPYQIKVSLGERKITVTDGEDVVYEGPVAIGAPETPTPTGRYFIRVLLVSDDPSTVYGPYAYGLSGHSEVLDSFNGGDAEVGIHGNNDASVLGKPVSHGCIRMDNAAITKLTQILPLGTPVDIVS